MVPRRSEGNPQLADQQGEAMNLKVKHAAALLVLGIASCFATSSHADEGIAKKTILFVCLHGSVKSQMAAAHFNKIASERNLPYVAISRGIEVDNSIPTRIKDGLSLDGLAPMDDVPKPLTPEEAAAAIKVIAFDSVPDDRRGSAEVSYWSDVPPATRDYAAARDAIVHHLDNLVPALAENGRSQDTLQGVVTAIDERNDQVTIRLASDNNSEFRVQDGLVFNAIHHGDRVKITVETVGGVRTIVGLKKL
jgi:protein-tyrosine-phosphatase